MNETEAPRGVENEGEEIWYIVDDKDLEMILLSAVMSGNKEAVDKFNRMKKNLAEARANGLIVELYEDEKGHYHYRASKKRPLGFRKPHYDRN